MNPSQPIERAVLNLCRSTSAKMDERIVNDAQEAFAQAVPSKQLKEDVSVCRIILAGSSTRLIFLGLIIMAVLVGIGILFRRTEKPIEQTPAQTSISSAKSTEVDRKTKAKTEAELQALRRKLKLEQELSLIVKMFARDDVNSLVRMLVSGMPESKVLVAKCLAKVGDERALPALEKLSMSVSENMPEGFQGNPFADAIAEIKTHLERQQAVQAAEKLAEEAAELSPKTSGAVSYSGTVTNESNQPIEAATVRCELHWKALPWWSDTLKEIVTTTTTDSNGNFETGYLPGRNDIFRHSLVFEHPDYATVIADNIRQVDTLDISFLKAMEVAGLVVDMAGQPVTNVKVKAGFIRDSRLPYMGSNVGLTIETDSQGRFSLGNIFEGASLDIDVLKKGYQRYTTRQDENDSYQIHAGQKNLVITLKPGGIVRGGLFLGGQPYEKEGVVIRAIGEDAEIPAITDVSGEFELLGLALGYYSVIADNKYLADTGLTCEPIQDVLIETGAEATVKLALEEGLPVLVRLFDKETDSPAASQKITVASQISGGIPVVSASTDANGHVELILASGNYVLKAKSWELGEFQSVDNYFTVSGEDLEVEIGISLQSVIKGVLVDTEGLARQGIVMFENSKDFETDQSGFFAIPQPEGPVTQIYTGFAFDAEGQLGRGFIWQQADVQKELEIVLEPLAGIVGRIVDENDEAIEGVELQIGVSLPDGKKRLINRNTLRIIVEQDGWFRIENLPVGLSYILYWQDLEKSAITIDQLKPGQILYMGNIKWLGTPQRVDIQ